MTHKRAKEKELLFEALIPEVEEAFKYSPKTGNLIRVKPGPGARTGCVAGYIQNEGYRVLEFKKFRIPAHRLVWRLHKGVWPEGVIDHINGVMDDNRIENLRDTNFSTNNQNTYRNRRLKYEQSR